MTVSRKVLPTVGLLQTMQGLDKAKCGSPYWSAYGQNFVLFRHLGVPKLLNGFQALPKGQHVRSVHSWGIAN